MNYWVAFVLFFFAQTVFAELPPRPGTPPSPTGTKIAVANRNAETVTLIDMESERKVQIELEEGSEPMYAQNPFFSDEIWIGDRGHSRVLVYDALRLRRTAEIPTGNGVFHMWNHGELGQMWVVNDIDKTMTVISLETKEVLATVPIPEDLAADFKPHDITVTKNSAIVSLFSTTGKEEGWLIKYSGKTFKEKRRLKVGGDPHLLFWGFKKSKLYVATQDNGKVLRINPRQLRVTGTLDIPGAHGIWANEQETHLYVTDIESGNGSGSLYTIDLKDFSFVEGSPVDAALPFPHNVMVSITNHKLFVTHSYSGSEFTSIYDLDDNGIPMNGRSVTTGDIPFGIMLIRDPICDC